MNKIDKVVNEYLQSQNIAFYARELGFKFKSDFGSSDNPWACDEWHITFRNSDKIQLDTEYFTGVGYRVLKHIYKNNQRAKKDLLAVKNYLTPKTEQNISILLHISVPVKPTAASVLYSLVMDMQALDTSFEHWCADYGHNSDSISHFGVYQKCCNVGKQMKEVFTIEQIKTIHELLQDY